MKDIVTLKTQSQTRSESHITYSQLNNVESKFYSYKLCNADHPTRINPKLIPSNEKFPHNNIPQARSSLSITSDPPYPLTPFHILDKLSHNSQENKALLKTEGKNSDNISLPQRMICSYNSLYPNSNICPTTPLNKNKPLSCLTINARSLLNKINDLRTISYTSSPSLISVTETWLDSSIPDSSVSLDNYVCYRNDRSEGAGGGVMIYIHKSIKSHFVELKAPEPLELVCAMIYMKNDSKLLTGTIYRPPKFNASSDRGLHDLFTDLSNYPATFKLFTGDFNLPDVIWKTHRFPFCLDLFSTSLHTGDWKQHITEPTRGNNTLDLIFSWGIKRLKAYIWPKFPNSDHKMLYCCFSMHRAIPNYKNYDYVHRNWSNISHHDTISYIRSCNWSKFFCTDKIDECSEEFYLNFYSCMDYLAPLSIKPTANKNLFNYLPPNTRQKLRQLYKDFHVKKDFSAYVRIREIYQECEQRRNERLRNEELLVLTDRNCAKGLARLYRKRSSADSQILALTDPDTKSILENPRDICNVFSKHFASCFLIENDYIKNKQHSNSPLDTLNTIHFTTSDICKTINSLNNSKSLGPDGMPSCMVKSCLPDIASILVKYFNLSLASGHYPDAWKTSHIRPKFKSGSRLDPSNYRPINITSILSRILEKIVKEQMSNYFLSLHVISPAQHGFLSNRSCSTCQVDFLNHIISLRDEDYNVAVLYFDFSKAFDTVSHPRLLQKLKNLGITDSLILWISSFLSNRKQIIEVNSVLSDPVPVPSGVIQGSVLGPLLFLIYINDITKCIVNGCPYLYADDLKIVYKLKKSTIPDDGSRIQDDLNRLESWCKSWAMKLNVNKCGIMHIGKNNINASLTLNDSALTTLTSVKDLGIIYDQSLSVADHVKTITAKANRSAGFIHRNFTSTKSKVSLYRMYVRPKLEYCSFVLCIANKSDITKIERVQRKFTRCLHSLNQQTPYEKRCEAHNLQPLSLRRAKQNLTLLYKIIHSNVCSNIDSKFKITPHYCLRNSTYTLFIPRCNKSLKKRSFLIRYSTIWNRLPEDIRKANTTRMFNNKLNCFLTISTLNKLIYPYHVVSESKTIPNDL